MDSPVSPRLQWISALTGIPNPTAMNASAMKEPNTRATRGGAPNSWGDCDQRKINTVRPMNPNIEKKTRMNQTGRGSGRLGGFNIISRAAAGGQCEGEIISPARRVNYNFAPALPPDKCWFDSAPAAPTIASMNHEPSPEMVVQRQLDAYNARDVQGILATYAADAQQFEFPDKLLATGTDQLRERFAARFQEPNLHARLLHRTVVGTRVIDHEEVTRTFPEGPGTIQLVAIYEVRDGTIARAWFMNGPRNPQPAAAPSRV